MTLSCQLYYNRLSSYCVVHSEGIELVWVNQADVNLQTDSRFQILSSGQCIISLTTTLLNEDHNRVEMSGYTEKSSQDLSHIYCQVFS